MIAIKSECVIGIVGIGKPLLAQYWRGSGAFSALNAVTDKPPLSVCSEFSFFDRPRCSAAAPDERTAEQRGGPQTAAASWQPTPLRLPLEQLSLLSQRRPGT